MSAIQPRQTLSHQQLLEQAFDPNQFEAQGQQLIPLLSRYLKQVLRAPLGLESEPPLPVYSYIEPTQLRQAWATTFETTPCLNSVDDLMVFLQRVLDQSMHLHHPRYVGHQVGVPLPLTALMDMVGTLLNNPSSIYEMGPVNTMMELALVAWMADLIGYDPEQAGGIFTSGGTLGNLTALLVARQAKAPYDCWEEGFRSDESYTVLVSAHAHYCIKRAVQIMGWGSDGATLVEVTPTCKMTRESLDKAYHQALSKGKKPIAVVGSACLTATGAYDPLDMVADFAQEHDLWFHVDGAHGASALLSPKYKHLLAGVHRADSVVWDAHKLMMTPGLTTALVFKNRSDGHQAFHQKAAYILAGQGEEEWYNLGYQTFECTKRMMGFPLYTALMVYGTEVFTAYVEKTYDLARAFADLVEASDDFVLATVPESNILCFRYEPKTLPPFVQSADQLQSWVRQRLLEEGRYYLLQAHLPRGTYLRMTLMNPFTELSDLDTLLEHIRDTVHSAQS